MALKLGGLFSGVGGFELAWTRLGGEVAWMCENDINAQKVLRAWFPDVPIFDDVRDLDPSQVEAVDVLTGGSPCQGFSVAGSRSGLEHGESRLFADYVRIMEGLAVRGLQFALWENVPGVLSIENDDGERTFEHVVAALVGSNVPVRLGDDGRWNTGLAVRERRAVAWRVLDSRYFGVAQRRRRVFACVALGDSCEDRAGRTLLAVSEGLRRDFESVYETGEGVTGGVAEGVGRTGVGDVMRKVRSDEFVPDVTGSTLAARDYKDYGDLVVSASSFRKSARVSKPGTVETWVDDGLANTLNAFDVGDVRTTHAILEPTVCVQGSVEGRSDTSGPQGSGWKVEESFTLNTADRHAVTDITGEVAVDFGRTSDRIRINAETAATLQAGDGGGGAKSGLYMTNYGVRRLTPVECERLQSFPNGWTEPAGSDSARYKAMGNAVTVNVVQWILGRMITNLSKEK